jgi:hypothetical protein
VSAHRQHYFDANAQSARPARAQYYVGNVIAVTILLVVAIGATASHVRERLRANEPVVTAVPMPILTSVEEARIEGRIRGYTEGFDAGFDQGCKASRLSHPIAAR